MLTIIQNAVRFRNKRAIIDQSGTYTYQDLLTRSEMAAGCLLAENYDLNQSRVAFMVAPSMEYVAVQWGIWRAGGIAVPLCVTYPFPSLQYVLEDTQAEYVVVGPEFEEILSPYRNHPSTRFIPLSDLFESPPKNLPEIDTERGAMILYTSGTTNLPKGVLTTHNNIQAQITTLVEAWHWDSTDHTLSILPLHHVHGIINVTSCALWSGATLEYLPQFDAESVLEIFKKGDVNVFMSVPTIYYKLIAYYDSLPELQKGVITEKMKNFRLMVSGSAALPVSVMERWHEISGHYLLERYGMTEIGMAVSNPYHGERRAGFIGQALKGVEVRLCDEHDKVTPIDQPGEIQVRGKSVFGAYWGKPEATAKAFTTDGWFKTGDIAVVENGYFKILGRDSVDIIKSGGYKISALEIEEVLRTHPAIKDCGVVGIPDEEWGEKVVAALVTSSPLDGEELNQWMRKKMPAYKTPRKYLIVDDLPRNAMGKITKNELKKIF
jgi:malonyl-CoA/methylmalonyl-CoA synthetase